MSNDKTTKVPDTGWRDLLTAPAQNQTAVLAVFFFASCLVLPLANDTLIATVYMVACVLFYYGMNRSLRALLQYALPTLPLILLSQVLPGVPNAMTLPCAYVALLVGGSTGAFLLTHYHNPKGLCLLILLPAAAYGAVALLTGNPLRALLCLLPVALATVASICLLRCLACKDAVVLVAVALAVLLIGSLALAAGLRGVLNRTLPDLISDGMKSHLLGALEQARATYAEAGLELPLSEVDVTGIAASVLNIAPGILLALCAVAAFLLWRSLLNMLVAFGSLPRLPRRLAGFAIGRMAAVVYLASTVVSLFAGSTLVGAVCENLNLAMEPGLALIGCATMFAKGEQRSCLSTILSIGVIVLLFVDLFAALSLAALFGAVSVLLFHASGADKNDRKGE